MEDIELATAQMLAAYARKALDLNLITNETAAAIHRDLQSIQQRALDIILADMEAAA